MEEKVFLSKKQVILGSALNGSTSDEIACSLSDRLRRSVTVKDLKGRLHVESSEVGHSVVSYGSVLLEDGKRGYVLSVSMLGTSVVGMFFYCEGETYLTEMVDPDRRRVAQVIKGRKI